MTAVERLLALVEEYADARATADGANGEALADALLAQIAAATTRLANRHGVPVVEHALLMSAGSMQVRPTDPEIERVYPLAKWLAHHQAWGPVYTRTVIVVDDWHEAEPAKEVQP